ncbi:MAG: hypothetical protein J7539_12910 [Niabella sp.]|nr:hypothetical protein [Niabella sp.]
MAMLLGACSFAQQQIEGFTIPELVPKPFAVSGVRQTELSLNGQWLFQIGAAAKQNKIEVPGEWEMQDYTVREGETGIYTKALQLPADWKGKVVKLRFDGVSSHAVVKVNGIKIAEHEGSFVPFEADITSALKSDNNVLQVAVQANTISDKLACTSQYAAHTVGGILRNVVLRVLPKTYISDLAINTVFDDTHQNATLQINTAVEQDQDAYLYYLLRDANGKIVVSKTEKCKSQPVVINVKQPRQWNTEQPYLYELTVELSQKDGAPIEVVKQKVGFRQVSVSGNQLLVNGQPIKMRGVNRHSIYPLTGRSITADLDVKDAVLFRNGNCNYIRTSHYPPTEAFLNACDSLGLFVESESSLCWINHGAAPIWKLWNYKDEKFLPYMIAANVEKMVAQRNHPSVIIWSLGNESVWSELWDKVNTVTKKLDPTRPTTFHDQCWGGFNNAHSKADIAVYHYPGINGPAACDTMSRPVLFGEYAHISCYSRRELLTDPGVREAYGAPLVQLYDSMYHHKGCLGGAIWSGIDDIFHMPDGRIIGYGPWGPVDGWRRAKPEYYGMKKAYSPVRVLKVEYPSGHQDGLRVLVENRYDFINLRDVLVQYTTDGDTKKINVAIAPHRTGVIELPVGRTAREISIRFTDPRGFVAEEEKIRLQKDEFPMLTEAAVSATENDAAIEIQLGNITYLISKQTGILSAKKGEKLLMKQGPVPAIVPMNYEDGGKPNVAGETYQNNIYPIKDYPLYTLFAKNMTIVKSNDQVKVAFETRFYDGSDGEQSYTFATNGTVTTEYLVNYRGKDVTPRQYGLMLQLPKSFDQLSWSRKGAFSSYPSNDIGRTEGEAQLNAKHIDGVEEWGVVPKADWKDDANDLGSNDFRSTKRAIYFASLTDNSKDSVAVLSDGKQSSRSWLQDEAIQWLIADYNNNGSEPFYGTPFTDGKTNIKDKTLKGKVVFVIR